MRITQYSTNVYKNILSDKVNLYYMPRAKLWKIERYFMGKWVLISVDASYKNALEIAKRLSEDLKYEQ